ncbi:MAG TPA: response regulator [Rhizomicrobium sp.]
MSDDLVSLRIIGVSANVAEFELWRQGAGLSSVPVEFSAHDVLSGTALLGTAGADICLIDEALPEADKAAVIAAARARKPQPLIFVAGIGKARPDGIDGALKKPSNVDDGRKLIEICVRARFPTRVLIVDDSGTMRSIVRKILSSSRFALDMQEAAEGFAALEQLRSGKFGLVFLDYNMPGFNGLETLSEIKRESPTVAVVMMTSTLDNAIADRAHAAGALAFLKKPFYPADIDRLLERYFGLHAFD